MGKPTYIRLKRTATDLHY